MNRGGKPFSETYLGRLREKVGDRMLMVPGVRAVVENDAGEVLLQRRRDIAIWGLPGGGSEEGESIQATLEREVREETGLSNDESQALRFFARDALPEMLPNERLSLDRYFEYRRTGEFQLI